MILRRLRDVTEKTSFLRFARDVLKTSGKRHPFEMFLKRLKDVTKKTSFLRRICDVLKTSQKKIPFLRCFWEVSEISPSMEI